MRSQKTVFIIPGFGHKTSQKGYVLLRKKLKSEGYTTISMTIPWQGSTIVENTAFFLKKYQKKLTKLAITSKDVYLLGFSYGALIAFLASTRIPVKGLILCSLSPFFKEDLPKKLSPRISPLQEKRHNAFSKLRARYLAKKIKAKTVCMLYGEKESASLIKRSKLAFGAISSRNKYLFSIQKTDHTISDKKYINAIHFASFFL